MLYSASSTDFVHVKPINAITLIKKSPKKHVVLLCVATWCGYCTRLTPIISEVDKYFQGKIDFLFVSEETPQSKVLHTALNVRGYPTVFLINDDGTVNVERPVEERSFNGLVNKFKKQFKI